MLALKIKDIAFKNPIMVASGTYGYGNEVSDFVDLSRFGAIITKSVTRNPREGNPAPRIFEVSSGMLNSIGLANLGVEKYIDEKIPYLNKIDTNIIINIAGTRIDDYIETLEMLDNADSKHIGYEINISCPNVKEGGMQFGVSPDMTRKLTQELRKRTDKILIMKLSPNVTSIQDIGLAAQDGGADAVSAINTVIGMSIDINTRKPRLSTVMGGLSGPCIKPVALANVYKLFKSLDIPIIGIGGISNCDDVIEFMLTGARFIQLGTINYKYPNLVETLTDELQSYLGQHSIDHIKDIVGDLMIEDK
jgi:dihydroorotate dehydrogenase (NAD+) catalytic subunit